MENEVFNFNYAFTIRALNEENNDFIITLGDHLATPEHFKSYEEAEKSIAAIDWNLVASLANLYTLSNEFSTYITSISSLVFLFLNVTTNVFIFYLRF
jgi:hypothetical protein